MLTKSQHKNLVFLPFPKGLDDESFMDWDGNHGMSYCLYVKGGIVTEKKHEKSYREEIAIAHKFFTNGD